MKTVNELKKTPSSELHEVITLEVENEKLKRQVELNDAYLARHLEIDTIPDFIDESSAELAMCYVQGSLEMLLVIAIKKLQTAEAEIEALKQELYHKEV